MLLYMSLGVFLVTLIFIGAGVWRGRITKNWMILTLLIAGAIASVVIINLPNIGGLVFQYGEKESWGFTWRQIQQTATQVTTQAAQVETQAQQVQTGVSEVQTSVDEVRQLKEQVETLVKRVEKGEQNVAQMYGAMQQTWRSLFESFAYIVGTRNLLPPPDFINKEVERHVNIIAGFAYPDVQERKEAIRKVMANVNKAQQ